MKPSRQAVINLDKVWKTYRRGRVNIHALRGVSLSVRRGEFLAITGKSGSGKSTIMNLVGCLDLPSQGHIYLDGNDVSLLGESKLARIRGKKIGFIFQQFNLISTLTALENVALPAAFQLTGTGHAHRRARALLTFVGMQERLDHKPTELSGGQMQRVAIARALMNDPEVILADEPTGSLDSKTGDHMMMILQDLNRKQGKSIIIVTHDQQLVSYANRVIELKDGEIVRQENIHPENSVSNKRGG